MARIRTVKPEFWEDERVGTLSRDARLLFIATFNMADDEGLLRWTAEYVKAAAFMYDQDLTVKDVARMMAELVGAGLLFPYTGGKARQNLAYIVRFHRHQKINRPQPSRLPPPSLQSAAVRAMYGRRDGMVCHLCHEAINLQPLKDERFNLSIDHVSPRSNGGLDYPSNVAAAHCSCNKSRRNNSLNDSVSDAMNNSTTNSPPEGNGMERIGKGMERSGTEVERSGMDQENGNGAGGSATASPPRARAGPEETERLRLAAKAKLGITP